MKYFVDVTYAKVKEDFFIFMATSYDCLACSAGVFWVGETLFVFVVLL